MFIPTALQIAFVVTAIVTVMAALMVVSARNLFHAALWLIVALFGVAVVFALLEASFLVVAQVAVYIGAIAILIIFAIMLTQGVMRTTLTQVTRQWGLGALVAIAVFLGLWLVLVQVPHWIAAPAGPVSAGTLSDLGLALVDPDKYALPFEVASVLLLAAMIGSIVIARDKK